MQNYKWDKKTGQITRCDDLMDWARFMENNDRRVARDEVGDIYISTVFLGTDHGWRNPEPILFETMIFGGEHDGYQERCSTYDEAVKMHEVAVNLVKSI